MFPNLRDIKDGAMTGLIIGLIILLIASMSTCTYYRNDAKDLHNDKVKAELEHQITEQKLRREKTEIESQAQQRIIIAYEEHTYRLQELAKYNADNANLVNGVQHSTKETIKYLPSMDRAALETITQTFAERLSEGAALLAKTDAIAREYDEEIELILASCRANFQNDPNKTDQTNEQLDK